MYSGHWPPPFYIAQVQDDFYGNVGTYKVNPTEKSTKVLLITKIESCRVGRVQMRIRKIGGSNPPLGTKIK